MEYQNLFIHCITLLLDCSEDRYGHACTIYKCLMQWQPFEVKRTQAIEVGTKVC